ncbi:hypothetical protein Chor_000905 [Crotalus horridus]
MAVDDFEQQLVSCSMDDTVRYTSLNKKEYSSENVIKMDVQPKCVAVGPGGYAVVICIGEDKKKCLAIDNPGFEPEAVSIHPGDAHRLHHISGLAWLDEHTLVTTSHDASVKEWSISYK